MVYGEERCIGILFPGDYAVVLTKTQHKMLYESISSQWSLIADMSNFPVSILPSDGPAPCGS